MKIKLKDIPGLLPKNMNPEGRNLSYVYGYDQALTDCGEREVEICKDILEALYKRWLHSSFYEIDEQLFQEYLPQLLRAVK